MAARIVTRKKVEAPAPTSTKSLPTATLGLAMIIITNYQA